VRFQHCPVSKAGRHEIMRRTHMRPNEEPSDKGEDYGYSTPGDQERGGVPLQGKCVEHRDPSVSSNSRGKNRRDPSGILSAAHRNCLASLVRGNMVCLQVIWFPKPWNYFCNGALRHLHRRLAGERYLDDPAPGAHQS
jgi:hypothetical protein